MTEPVVLAIVGPTAVGKSAVAVRLARQIDGEIINADSRQVYRGFNIGAGIPGGERARRRASSPVRILRAG